MAVTEQTIPMARLQAAPEQTLTLAKEGPGKLYYRLGLRYAPAELKVAPEAQGFVVYRTYEAVGQGAEKPPEGAVRQLEDGTWQIKAGTTVKVNLTLVAKDRANFVVVDDPLPAGLEGQNSRFQTTLQDLGARVSFGEGGAPQLFFRSSGARPWIADWWYPWWTWDHTELRDDRLLLFADRLPAGIYTYSYIARATTIGDFVLPPIHAEGMYTPERFGHSASGRVARGSPGCVLADPPSPRPRRPAPPRLGAPSSPPRPCSPPSAAILGPSAPSSRVITPPSRS